MQREASRLPIAAHMFNLVEHAAGVSSAGVDFAWPAVATADTAKFDISLYAAVADDEFTLGAAYATELYDAGHDRGGCWATSRCCCAGRSPTRPRGSRHCRC